MLARESHEATPEVIHHAVTPLWDTGVVHVVTASRAPEGGETLARFARAVVAGLPRLDPEDLGPGTLTLPLVVSAWMRDADLDTAGAGAALLAVREAVVAAASLDRASEPVPLMAGDRRRALLSLAVYVDGLVRRAVSQSEFDADGLADAVCDRLAT